LKRRRTIQELNEKELNLQSCHFLLPLNNQG
jgi:hypothetical protein